MTMKNIEKSLKHWLKNKVKFTVALMVAFMISGQVANAESKVVAGTNNTITSSELSMIGAGGSNTITKDSDYSMIGVGKNNVITNSYSSIIIGGSNNNITGGGGYLSPPNFSESIIGAGSQNTITSSLRSMIGVGEKNTITSSYYSIIIGGRNNTITGGKGYESPKDLSFSMIGAGEKNTITSSDHSIIGAGGSNTITSSDHSIIGAGGSNTITKDSSTSMIGAGTNNTITSSLRSMIGAGDKNNITESSDRSMIGAGDKNTITSSYYSMIGAGDSNTITEKSKYSMIGAGHINKVEDSDYSMIGAGDKNNITESSDRSMIGAGEKNTITRSDRSMIGAGFNNTITSSLRSMIGAGEWNTITSSYYSMIIGGRNNTITGNSNASMIGAGDKNNITESSDRSMIGAGEKNTITSSDHSIIGAGTNNTITSGSHNTFIFGSYSKANYTSDAVLLGKYVKGVAGAISVGGGSEFYATGSGNNTIHYNKIVNMHAGDISETSHDAINGSQLYKLAKATDTNIDTAAWKKKLGVGDGGNVDLTNYFTKEEIENSYYDKNNVDTKLDGKANVGGDNLTNIANWQSVLQIGTGTIGGANDGQTVTGATVKNYVENKNYITAGDIDSTIVDGNITKGDLLGSDEIEVTGSGKLVGANLSLSLKNGSISQGKLDKDLSDKINEIDNKANLTNLDNYSKIDASNINVEKYKEKLGINDLSSIDDLENYYTKEEIENSYYDKNNVDMKLDGKVNVGGDNLTNISNWQSVLQIGTGTIGGAMDNQSVTGTTVKNYIVQNYYNKDEIDTKINDIDVSEQISGKADTDLGNISAEGKTVIKNITQDAVSVVAGDNTTVTTKTTTDGNIQYAVNVDLSSVETDLDGKADIDLGNITEDGKTVINDIVNENHYTKVEVDNKIKTIDVGNQLERIENIENVNKIQNGKITNNTVRIEQNENAIVENSRRIDGLSHDIEDVRTDTKHVGALSAALAGLHPMQYDPMHPNQIMAAIGSYKNNQAVALGGTHYFNENLMMNFGVSTNTNAGNKQKLMANLGFTWKLGSQAERERYNVPERYNEKQMSSIYMMQTEMDRVLFENQQEKAKNKEQEIKLNNQTKQNILLQNEVKNQKLEISNLKNRLEKLEKLLTK